MRFGVSGLGFRVSGLSVSCCRVWGIMVPSSVGGLKVQGFMVSGFGVWSLRRGIPRFFGGSSRDILLLLRLPQLLS